MKILRGNKVEIYESLLEALREGHVLHEYWKQRSEEHQIIFDQPRSRVTISFDGPDAAEKARCFYEAL